MIGARVRASFARFLRAERGSIALMVTAAMLVLLMIAGLAVNSVNAYRTKAALQSAVDAAALAAGAEPGMSLEELKKLSQSYIEANLPGNGQVRINEMSLGTAPGGEGIVITVKAESDTFFGDLYGQDIFTYNISSGVKPASGGPLELVLVLDTTGSMQEPLAGRKRIDWLREAASDLVKRVLKFEDAKVGLVPFNRYINTGLAAPPPWATPPGTKSSCSYPQKKCQKVPKPCPEGVTGICTEDVCVNGPCVPITITEQWSACVGPRPEGLRASIKDPLMTRYPHLPISRNDDSCASPLLPLTGMSDRNELIKRIDSFKAVSGTFIPGGLVWGWNLLDPRTPFGEPGTPGAARTAEEMKKIDGRKVIVLMSDGENTLSPINVKDGILVAHSNTTYRNRLYTDQLTRDLCREIKKQDIIIYTVLLAVHDPVTKDIMETCATDSKKFYYAETAHELKESFTKIGRSLSYLRLVQ